MGLQSPAGALHITSLNLNVELFNGKAAGNT